MTLAAAGNDKIAAVQDRFYYGLYGNTRPALEFAVSPHRKSDGGASIYADWMHRAKPTSAGLWVINQVNLETNPGTFQFQYGGGKTLTIRGRLRDPEFFFRPVPFLPGKRTKEFALPSAVVFTEVDNRGLTKADVTWLKSINATVVYSGGVADDGGRKTHIYIPLDAPHPPAVIERLNRALRDKLGGDKFDLTTLLRVPGTHHRKDPNNPVPVRVALYSSRDALVSLPELASALGTELPSEDVRSRVSGEREAPTGRPLTAVKPKGAKWGRARNTLQKNNGMWEGGGFGGRHQAVFALVKDLARLGLTLEEAVWVAEQGPTLEGGKGCAAAHDKAAEEDTSVERQVTQAWNHTQAVAVREERVAQGTATPTREGERAKSAGAGTTATGGRRLILTAASTFKARRTLWLWDTTGPGQTPTSQGRIPMGALTIGAGAPGIAKSQAAIWLVAEVTQGTLPGEFFGKPRSVIYCATEDSWEQTIVPRLMAAGADMTRVFHVGVSEDNDRQARLSLPDDVDALGEECDTYGVALIIADPLISFLADSIDDYREREVRKALEPLMAMADRHIVTVYGLAHFTKNGGSDPLSRIHGSGAFGRVVRAAIAFTKTEDGGFVMSQVKNNLGRTDMPSFSYTVQDATVYDEDGGAIYTSRFVLGEESETDVTREMEAANTKARGGKTKMDRCIEWLTKYLGDKGGSVERDQVMADAKIMGFTQSMLYKVRDSMGVRIEQSGFGGNKTSTWSL